MRGFEIVIAALVISFGLYGFVNSKPTPSDPVDLTFTAVDGSTVDLTRLRGKVVLLDFWGNVVPVLP